MKKKDKVKMIVLLVVAGGLIGYLFYDSLLFLIIVPFALKPTLKYYGKVLEHKRQEILRRQFKDMMYSLSASFATGRQLKDGLKECVVSLGKMYGAEEPIMEETNRMLKEMDRAGSTDMEVFDDFAKRAAVPDIDDFVSVYGACRETGGNLIKAMNKTAVIIGEKIRVEGEIHSMVSQKKFEGKIITIMPVAIIIFLRIMSPEYIGVMYGTPSGILMMTLALAAIGAAFFMIERITNIDV